MTTARLLESAERPIRLAMCLLSIRVFLPVLILGLGAQAVAAEQPKPSVTLPVKPTAAAAAAEQAKSGATTPSTASKPAPGPKQIGKFDDWTAATFQEGGTTVCYAFSKAQSSTPTVAGRGGVIITITQRPSIRDVVAIDAGFAFAANTPGKVIVDPTTLDFYTDKATAFARDGRAAVGAFGRGAKAVARYAGPQNAQVVDNFSLKGFGAAYAAITKACPSK